MKPDSNYKMSGELKMMLDMMQDREARSVYKKMMVQAEHEASMNRRRKLIKFEAEEESE